MPDIFKKFKKQLSERRQAKIMGPISAIWSSTSFGDATMTDYAEQVMTRETRQGVITLGLVALILFSGAALLYAFLELGGNHTYTYAALAALALHVFLSAKTVKEIKALHLLGMTLLIISGVALVLLAHQTGTFSAALFAGVALLFMVIPLVPWGLREGALVTGLIYAIFTASTMMTVGRFSTEALWALQFFMLSAGLISIALVVRAVMVRKHDIKTRFELEGAHREMALLSQQDPLTAAWNRRYLELNFESLTMRYRDQQHDCYFAILDIDKFKNINDNCGHRYGDAVLQATCYGFRQIMKTHEVLVRMGGDEFALMLDADQPRQRIKRAIEAMREYAIRHGRTNDPVPTISLGLTRLPSEQSIGFKDAYNLADESMYTAKRAGGNKLVEHPLYRRASTRPELE